jgi:hypothetical protein
VTEVVRGKGIVRFSGAALFKPGESPAADVEARFIERAWMAAHDDRTLIQKWLGDPSSWRSAHPSGNSSVTNCFLKFRPIDR